MSCFSKQVYEYANVFHKLIFVISVYISTSILDISREFVLFYLNSAFEQSVNTKVGTLGHSTLYFLLL